MPSGERLSNPWETSAPTGVAEIVPAQTEVAEILPAEQLQPVSLLQADTAMWAVVLAGGIGSRFWPLSSPERPKQLLRLVCDQPLIAETVGRLHPVVPSDRVLVVTSADIAPALHAAIPDVPEANMLVETHRLGTAAALAWGVHEVARRAGPNALLCVLHADLAVGFPEAFRHTMREASAIAARDDVLVSVGAAATRPETGFGYIVPGAPTTPDYPLAEGGPAAVVRFIEKPDATAAETLVAEGALWNTGIFCARASIVMHAMREFTPEIAHGFPLLDARDLDGFAAAVRSVSLERGLLERCRDHVVVPGDFGWDDVGTWASLRRARDLDDEGNGAIGDVHFVDSSGNVVHAEGSSVAIYGVEGLLVVSLPGITFVTTLECAADLRPLLEQLPSHVQGIARRD